MERLHISAWIRQMAPDDLPNVKAIEIASFEFPWTEEDFHTAMNHKRSYLRVAQVSNKIVGYMAFYQINKRIVLSNIAVAEEFRRRDIGTQMFDNLVAQGYSNDLEKITLNVREKNVGAQEFFRYCGCKAVKVLHNPYRGLDEDSYLMRFRLRPKRKGSLIW